MVAEEWVGDGFEGRAASIQPLPLAPRANGDARILPSIRSGKGGAPLRLHEAAQAGEGALKWRCDGRERHRRQHGPRTDGVNAGVSELEVLRTCALRIDGYLWADHQGIEREALLQPFWHEDARVWLLEQSWDHQWAAWFMQERTLRWSDAVPSGAVLTLWRELFLSLAEKRPSPPYDRGLAGDGTVTGDWEARFAPQLGLLRQLVGERLSRAAALDEAFGAGD